MTETPQPTPGTAKTGLTGTCLTGSGLIGTGLIEMRRLIEKIEDPRRRFVGHMAIKDYSSALTLAEDETDRRQVIDNAILCGDYRCVKESGARVNWPWFVREKVLPYLRVYDHEGRYFIDEETLRASLEEIGGDGALHIETALGVLDARGYRNPIHSLILAQHTNDPDVIARYEERAALVPERTDLEGCLRENGIAIERVIQHGDTDRYFPKDGFVYLADLGGELPCRKVVLKELLRQHTDPSRIDGYSREDQILRQLSQTPAHPSIATYLGKVDIDGHEFLLEEYIEARPKEDGEEAVKGELAQLADACIHMRERRILYLDFKAKNILFDGTRYRIVDFGWSQMLREVNHTDSSTPRYIAPEVLMTCKADEKSDVFALGIYAHERLTGGHPFTDTHVPQHLEMPALIHYGIANTIDSLKPGKICADNRLEALVRSMLEKNPADRPTADQIKEALT